MSKIVLPNYVINRMEARGITESQISDALRNISKQEEKLDRIRITSYIINRYLTLITQSSYHKTTVVTAFWRQ